eukprot:5977797-Lingulodinium_polyedra.AAC.1
MAARPHGESQVGVWGRPGKGRVGHSQDKPGPPRHTMQSSQLAGSRLPAAAKRAARVHPAVASASAALL